MKHIILASTSPRRKELLTKMGVSFQAHSSNFEEHLDDDRSPAEVAKELGLGKALAVARQYPEALVIGSDTIVSFEGRQFGKPSDRRHAEEMLRIIRGKACDITTSLAVICLADNLQIIEAVEGKIYLKNFTDEQMHAYLDTGDHEDKAAAFGVQSGFGPYVDHLEGDADVIVGLPTRRLAEIFHRLGIPAHRVELHLDPSGVIL